MVFYDFLILIFSLFVLVKGADIFVENSAKLARTIGVSEFVIGLTLVSFGTSLPELATSISASISKESGLIMGNITGSNIANIGLILAIGTMLFAIETKERIFKRDSLFLLLTTILFIILSLDKIISFTDASLFLLIFFFYILHLFRSKEEKEIHYEKFANIKLKKDLFKCIILIILGVIGLYFGAKLLIPSTVNIATSFKVPTELIAVTLIAVGTSIPELFVTIMAARKKLEKILIGNIIGSNIANILLIIGVSGVINPVKVSEVTLYYFMPFMFLMTILLFRFIRTNWAARLLQGISLLLIYLVFILGLVFF